MSDDRMVSALHYLAGEFSLTREEFRRARHPGADMLLDSLVSKGYAREQGGRFAVTEAGRRFLADVAP